MKEGTDMNRISPPLTKAVVMTLDAVFKASDADIRLHGVENIPENRSLLFLINHFTRLETIFMPYILKKHLDLYTYSLAHHSFFGGSFGRRMEKLGAVSTKDPERDKIFIRSLLTGDNSTLIFPEGQMIKDKKLLEKGKFMVYNAGIRRPPHTGAARLALRSEFYRQKITWLHENKRTNELNNFKVHFELTDDDIEKIITTESVIIPVNITYYPVRARDNAINRLVDRFADLSERFEEELEIEGTMLLDGVDIDINLGKPIYSSQFLGNCKSAVKKKDNPTCYLDKKELKKEVNLNRASIDLMQQYMQDIYGMTTINYDHIFSYMLTKNPRNKIHKNDLKNKAFLAIEELKDKKISNLHTTLYKNQFHMLTDDEHNRFESFLEAAVSDKIITLEGDYLVKNRGRFSDVYQFHTIRQDNIVEVFTNEVEPQKAVRQLLTKKARMRKGRARRIIRDKFIKMDQEIFRQDYEKYYLQDETKPENIGAPYLLKKGLNRKGILLIHGYMAAPEEMRVVAEHLNRAGFAVYGVRLRGHGTAPEDLQKREWIEWYNSVNRGYVIMENLTKHFAIGGFSTGAGLALLQAARKKDHLAGAISISAPLKLQNITSHLSSAVVAWNNFLGKLHVSKGKMEFVSNTPENPHINYGRNPIKGVRELEKLMNVVEKELPDISIPVLVIQGSEDPVVNPESALDVFNKLGTIDKELYRVHSTRHGIVRGDTSGQVADQVIKFLKEIMP